jgi:hypothetical protein
MSGKQGAFELEMFIGMFSLYSIAARNRLKLFIMDG